MREHDILDIGKGKAMTVYRWANQLYHKNWLFLAKCLTMLNRLIFSVDIPYDAHLDYSVVLGHNGLGTVVHQKALVGKKTVIMQNVVIGGSFGKTAIVDGQTVTAPIIGDHVFIASGASVIGPVKIADYAVIGASAVVTKDVQFGEVVVGNPGKVIRTMTLEEAQANYERIYH